MGAILIKSKELWNHEAFFDYVERWMTQNETWYSELNALRSTDPCNNGESTSLGYQQGWAGIGGDSNFQKNMWNTYRNCSNGKMDGTEEGEDCGGICPEECPTAQCVLTNAYWQTS